MAQRVEVTFVDDLDGTEAAGTVTFGFEGVTYEIDLSVENTDAMSAFLAPFVAAARRTGGRVVSSRRSGKTPAAKPGSSGELAEIRVWARAQGHEVAERGRIAASIVDAFHASVASPERASVDA